MSGLEHAATRGVLEWIAFLGSAAVVVAAGARLSREGDELSRRTGLGAAFVGAILVAAATSLPELATTSFAVIQGSVGLALGDLFGTLMWNMAMLALAALAFRGRVFSSAAPEAAKPALIAVALCIVASVGISTGDAAGPLWLGWSSLALGVTYLAGVWMLRRAAPHEPDPGDADAGDANAGTVAASRELRPVVTPFVIASLAIVVAAYVLALSARGIAAQLGLSETFVGAALVGVVTSLPEATVAFAAFARGAQAIAFGALFGSNAFDVVIVLPLDALQGPGALLGDADQGAHLSVLFAALLMTMAVLSLAVRGERRLLGVDAIAIAMLLTYALGLYLTYRVAS